MITHLERSSFYFTSSIPTSAQLPIIHISAVRFAACVITDCVTRLDELTCDDESVTWRPACGYYPSLIVQIHIMALYASLIQLIENLKGHLDILEEEIVLERRKDAVATACDCGLISERRLFKSLTCSVFNSMTRM